MTKNFFLKRNISSLKKKIKKKKTGPDQIQNQDFAVPIVFVTSRLSLFPTLRNLNRLSTKIQSDSVIQVVNSTKKSIFRFDNAWRRNHR